MIRYLPLLLLLLLTLLASLTDARNVSLAGTENRNLEIPSSGKFIHIEAEIESHDRASLAKIISNYNTVCHHSLICS